MGLISVHNYTTKRQLSVYNHMDVVSEQTPNREVDFFPLDKEKEYKCEVKLMGKGNPESADAVIARDSSVFIADKLSDQNKTQLEQRGVKWVEVRDNNGFKRFKNVLENISIPHKDIDNGDFDANLDKIFVEIFTQQIIPIAP